MKTLVIVIHPDAENSIINKRWMEELNKHPKQYHIHQLHAIYPDEKIDVVAEQKLIEQYDKIVFQFPFYWFNCPPLLKKWLDEVFTYGWAYGSKSGYKVSGKKIALAMSIGIDEEEYAANGKYKYTIKELTRNFELTFEYIKADYQPFFAYYGLEQDSSEEWIEKSVTQYIDFMNNL
ncbi:MULTISPECIES: NAD(P)H-dependent oxidoreductase [Sphingobacterium]|uniref:NAD(P)H-dependent oxidoreductase n=1 Tax=Sphingobacterium kitahiroshimense TaxID=470446 RepID=A0ABV0BMM1_9SPHI|nr:MULTISPECIES: NAD(P)H-dependent oxidoreductase [unclassified Sphingobacterium]MCS3553872.1 putative NADPH-quinone reductase [Sphingobacterium sp. JUb21]